MARRPEGRSRERTAYLVFFGIANRIIYYLTPSSYSLRYVREYYNSRTYRSECSIYGVCDVGTHVVEL